MAHASLVLSLLGNRFVEPPKTQNFWRENRLAGLGARRRSRFLPPPPGGVGVLPEGPCEGEPMQSSGNGRCAVVRRCSSNVRASRVWATLRIARAQADRGHPFAGLHAFLSRPYACDVATALRGTWA
jgi:hypothetical protein